MKTLGLRKEEDEKLIVGLDFFGEQPVFDNLLNIGTIYRTDLQSVIVDQIRFDEGTNESDTSAKEEWGYNTALLAKFQNTLEAGNITNGGLKVTHLKIKKRKENDLQWQDIKLFTFDNTVTNYSYEDKLISSLDAIEYSVQPLGEGGVLGKENTATIDVDFDNLWIMGKDEQYQLIYNTELGNIETVQRQGIIETIGSQYPFIIDNAAINYKKTDIKALLLTDSTVNHTSGERIDKKAEKKLRTDIMNFFMDKKPKIFKDNSGNYMLVRITEPPVLIPMKELDNLLYEVTFNVIEIGNANDNATLRSYGFIE